MHGFLTQEMPQVSFRRPGAVLNEHKANRKSPLHVGEWKVLEKLLQYIEAARTVGPKNGSEGILEAKYSLDPSRRAFESAEDIAMHMGRVNEEVIRGLQAFSDNPACQTMKVRNLPPNESISNVAKEVAPLGIAGSHVAVAGPSAVEPSVAERITASIGDMTMAFCRSVPPERQLEARDVYLVEEIKKPIVVCSQADAARRVAPSLVESWNNPFPGTH